MRALRLRLPAAALLGMLAVAGCTRNTIILMGPVAFQAIPAGACLKPADTPPTAPAAPPISFDRAIMTFPAQARAAGIRIGCGGVLYHVDPEGRAADERLLTEFPAGYGFGEEALSEVTHMTFASGVVDPNWHYARLTMRLRLRPAPASAAAPMVGAVRPWGLVD